MPVKTKLSRRNFWVIAINSTSTFVLAYLFVFYLNLFVKVLMIGVFDYPIVVTYDTVYFLIRDYEWTHDSVSLIYSAGPILVFIFGILSLMAYNGFVDEDGRMKIIFIWFSLHAFNFVFSSLSIGNIFTHELGHVFNWMYLQDTSKMLIALVGFFGLILSAFIVTRPLFLSANAYFNKLNDRNMPFFITAQVIVPYIIGSVIGVLFFLPTIPVQEQYSWFVMGVLLIIVLVKMNSMESHEFDDEQKKVGNISWSVLVFTVLFILAIRIGLNEGISIDW
ncbi:MAG: hypothetical protein DRI89_04840 [Bacteroidetes bacterium]|nr:MAG: hypothetical protein DRI89_04840 [Bacteroidota bacterium]